jgi:hypothetical protein
MSGWLRRIAAASGLEATVVRKDKPPHPILGKRAPANYPTPGLQRDAAHRLRHVDMGPRGWRTALITSKLNAPGRLSGSSHLPELSQVAGCHLA